MDRSKRRATHFAAWRLRRARLLLQRVVLAHAKCSCCEPQSIRNTSHEGRRRLGEQGPKAYRRFGADGASNSQLLACPEQHTFMMHAKMHEETSHAPAIERTIEPARRQVRRAPIERTETLRRRRASAAQLSPWFYAIEGQLS